MVKLFQIIAVICVLIQILAFIFYFQKFLLIKIFPHTGSKIKWKKVRDPFILALAVSFLILSTLMALKIGFTKIYFSYTFPLFILAMIVVILLFYFKNFEVFEKIKIKSNPNKSNHYNLKWNNKEDLKLIYRNLEENDFIEFLDSESDILDYEYFSNLLCDGKTPKSPPFKLKMDNIQTKYFFDLLSQNSSGFTLDNFLRIFRNKNSQATRNSIEASFSNAKSSPKEKQEIDNVFLH